MLEAGAVLLPLNFRLAPHELAHILNDAGAAVLFLDPGSRSLSISSTRAFPP